MPEADQGSSPLTRGKRSARADLRSWQRLIPAHAGKTGDVPSHCEVRRAHPRSRGENLRQHIDQLRQRGSSPLTRGKRFLGAARNRVHGLIPAHAGKTMYEDTRVGAFGAHPRSRGENLTRPSYLPPGRGSSPLTRGKQKLELAFKQRGRLIPAHAGKTQAGQQAWARRPAHPRSRGENNRPDLSSSR